MSNTTDKDVDAEIVERNAAKGELVDPTPSKKRIHLHNAELIGKELRAVYREARRGEIEMQDATKLAYMLEMMRKMHETTVLEQRLNNIEDTLRENEK